MPLRFRYLPAASHQEKAILLQQRFFPILEASPSPKNIPAPNVNISISQEVILEDVQATLSRMGPWKAPGLDGLPAGFLKACGEPLARVLAILTTKCFQLEWFLRGLRQAKVTVLQKPGKEPAAYKTAGGYRPIALLPSVGKVIEAILAARISRVVEKNGLLLEEQMGNRQGRSTDLAVRLLVAQVQEASRHKAAGPLVQLDTKGS